MKVSDLLTPNRIVVPLEAHALEEALASLLQRLEEDGALSPGASGRLAAEIVGGKAGELIRVREGVILAAARTGLVRDLVVAVGVSPAGVSLAPVLPREWGALGAVLLVLTPEPMSVLRFQALPALQKVLRDEEKASALLSARTPADVLAFRELMELTLNERLLVEDVMTPMGYRVYPDTPLHEVVDLMVRRDLGVVPVVGEKYQVLGVVTAQEALKQLLPRRLGGEGEELKELQPPVPAVLARDVMSRSIMCVAQDQSLLDAANLMINKDVAEMPVVRQGEFVGFLSRDAILKKLFLR